jgi:GDP-L-fucose synthase
MNKKDKILVTGSNGLLGSQIIKLLKKNNRNYISCTSKKLNLVNYNRIDSFFKKNKPTHVIHTANKVYGIGGNKKKKFEMINENLIINSNLFKACKKYKIKKITCIGSSAVYSEKYKNKIKEKNIFKYKPHSSEFYYGISKRIMLHQLNAITDQSKIKVCYIVMNNLYGICDNFNTENGHVVPSLIHKFYLAKKRGGSVKLWGSPKTKRCLLYSKDAARMVLEISEKQIPIMNLSSIKEITIGKLANIISKIYKFDGKIIWVKNDFKGVDRRKLDTSLQIKYKIKEEYTLNKGLEETILWFKKNYSKNIRK